MEKLRIERKRNNVLNNTLCRTIRFDGVDYTIIEELAIKTGHSFNYIVKQMIKYAIKNMEG